MANHFLSPVFLCRKDRPEAPPITQAINRGGIADWGETFFGQCGGAALIISLPEFFGFVADEFNLGSFGIGSTPQPVFNRFYLLDIDLHCVGRLTVGRKDDVH